MRLLIIGSLGGLISEAGKIALRRGAKVSHAESIEEALGALRAGKGADLVMMDSKLNIGDFINQLETEHIALPVVACGIGTDAQSAVKAIKAGAKEYIPLPPDAELIAAVLEAVTEENNDMIANDPAVKQVVELANQIAPSDATVMISGESGTGKEVMAKYIHRKSKRKDKPFIAVNCAAIPENLLESELFGHEKGAFTGAVARRIGKFEEANGGTLLLDEISEMHPLLQAKLLRAIQEREIDRVGGNAPVKVDVRILATTNRDLQAEVQSGNFREDLYFRLNVVNLALPPLRERPGDIRQLSQYFADKYADHNGLPKKPVSTAALDKMTAYSWPGNIRELENTMHRAVLISREAEIEPEAIHLSNMGQTASTTAHLANTGPTSLGQTTQAPAAPTTALGSPPLPQKPPAVPPAPSTGQQPPASHPTADGPAVPQAAGAGLVGKTVAEVERELILQTLDHCLGNRTHAANILGISIRTLRNKLKQYTEEGIPIPAAGAGAQAGAE